MCYAIPAKVLKTKGRYATVEYFGEKRKVLRDLLSFKAGDYIYAQGGMAIRKIPVIQAREILHTWKELFKKLKERDGRIVNTAYSGVKLSKEFNAVLDKIERGCRLSRPDNLYLLNGISRSEAKVLYQATNRIRNKELGNSCCIHGIIEISNFCRRNCLYCGIRKGNKKLKRYRMKADEILETVDYAVNKRGFKVLVLQSGEDAFYTKSRMLEIIKRIRKDYAVLIFLSLGERDIRDYKAFYDAGARGVLLRFETSNAEIYARVRPRRKLKDRVNLIDKLRNTGYLVATGFLTGLPGEKDSDILNNILLTKKLAPEMYSFGPLIPHRDTPLGLRPSLKMAEDKALRVISLIRLLDKKSRILVTTALETLDRGMKEAALNAGANSLMINATPLNFRKFYDIYPRRAGSDLKVEGQIAENLKLLYRLGRAPTDLGTS